MTGSNLLMVAAGRVFSETKERAGNAVCVIGKTVREKLVARKPSAWPILCMMYLGPRFVEDRVAGKGNPRNKNA